MSKGSWLKESAERKKKKDNARTKKKAIQRLKKEKARVRSIEELRELIRKEDEGK